MTFLLIGPLCMVFNVCPQYDDYVSKAFGLQKLEYLTSFDGFKHDGLSDDPLAETIFSETQVIVNTSKNMASKLSPES